MEDKTFLLVLENARSKSMHAGLTFGESQSSSHQSQHNVCVVSNLQA